MTLKQSFRALGGLAVAASLGLCAVACGDDSGSSKGASATTVAAGGGSATTVASGGGSATTVASGGSSSPAAGTDPLGTPKKASGTPVKIGVISDGQSAAIDNTDELLTMVATAKWANDYLGGVGGHPIEVITCETKQDAAIATDCGNQMVSKGVAAVVNGVSGQSAFFGKPIQAAGIPLIMWQNTDVASDKKSTFVLSNALAAFLVPPVVARDKKLTSAATITVDVPGALGPAKSLGVAMLKKAGVTDPNVVAVPHETADMSPQVQAALTKKPQLVHIIGDGPFCAKALTALETAGYTGTITMISQCVTPQTVATVGDYLKGVYVGYAGTTDATDPDWKLYEAVVNKYASDPKKINLTSNPLGGFGAVSNFARLMADYKGDFSPADIVHYIKGLPAMPLYLGAGATMKCDGTAVAILPAICTKGYVQAVLDAKGQPTNFTAPDPGDLAVIG